MDNFEDWGPILDKHQIHLTQPKVLDFYILMLRVSWLSVMQLRLMQVKIPRTLNADIILLWWSAPSTSHQGPQQMLQHNSWGRSRSLRAVQHARTRCQRMHAKKTNKIQVFPGSLHSGMEAFRVLPEAQAPLSGHKALYSAPAKVVFQAMKPFLRGH